METGTRGAQDKLASGEFAVLQHLVDDAVLLGLRGGEDLVAVDVDADLLRRLAGVPGQGLLQRVRIRQISAAWISRSDTWP